MDIDFTSPKDVDKAVRQKISQMNDDEKIELIKKARKEDHFDLQNEKTDIEMLRIYVKYQLFETQM